MAATAGAAEANRSGRAAAVDIRAAAVAVGNPEPVAADILVGAVAAGILAVGEDIRPVAEGSRVVAPAGSRAAAAEIPAGVVVGSRSECPPAHDSRRPRLLASSSCPRGRLATASQTQRTAG